MIRRVPGSNEARYTTPLIIDTYRIEDELETEKLECTAKDYLVTESDSSGQSNNRAQWQYVVSSLAIASLLVMCVLLAVGVFTTTTGLVLINVIFVFA